jgi:outer membrane protein OmpA-like peptidoglycan-associated protein
MYILTGSKLGQVSLDDGRIQNRNTGLGRSPSCPSIKRAIKKTISGFPRYQNSAQSLPKSEQAKISAIAQLVVKSFQSNCQPIRTIHLIGHADKDTPRRPDFEKKISGDRALAVKNALTNAINQQRPGLAAQITWKITKAGATQLIVPNPTTEQERLRNRRVEILLGTKAKNGTIDPNRPPDIPKIQGCLNRILGTQLATDGIMGPKTHTAIRSFQQQQRLPVSGTLTPQTVRSFTQICSLPPKKNQLILTDVTTQMLQELKNVPKGKRCPEQCKCEKTLCPGCHYPCYWPLHSRSWLKGSPNPWPPKSFETPPLENLHYISSPSIAEGQLKFDLLSIDPDNNNLVLKVEREGLKAPQLIAISWPGSLTLEAALSTYSSENKPFRTPFLIYLRTTLGQSVNNGYYVGQNYPWGWDYLFYGPWCHFNYVGDELIKFKSSPEDFPYKKGLPYQIKASGKNVVLVMPLPKLTTAAPNTEEELGDFLDASFVQTLLQEINLFMFRRAGILNPSRPPEIGRVAFGTYSAGHGEVRKFLTRNKTHSFCLQKLKELYFFDYFQKSEKNEALLVDAALGWARLGDDKDKMIRVYTQGNLSSYGPILGSKVQLTGTSKSQLFGSGLRTVAYLPWQSWEVARRKEGIKQTTPSDVHQLIPGLMLTDALRRSGF